jgi:hypothetical protein
MQHLMFTSTRSYPVSIVALLLATVLAGCVAYTGQPSSGYNYAYSYPTRYYTGYPNYAYYPDTYTYSYNYRPYYSPDYNGYYNTYSTGGSGDR